MAFEVVVGIDVDSEGGYICVLSLDRKCLLERKYTNSELYQLITSDLVRIAPPNVSLVVMESTGGYSFFPHQVFSKMGYTVILENARFIKEYAKSFSFRGKKTDRYDAKLIALYGIERVLNKDYRPYEYSPLKVITRDWAKMRKQKQIVESVVFSRMVVIFPSITSLFGGNPLRTKVGRAIISNYSGWHHIVQEGLERLERVLCSVKGIGRYGSKEFVFEVYRFAEKMAQSGYVPDEYLVFSLRMKLEELEFFERAIEEQERYLIKIGADIQEVRLLRTIPGMGDLSSVVFYAEVGDIGRFKSRDSLVAYIGFDPKYEESGKSVRRREEISRAGISYLRAIVYMAVLSLTRKGKLFHEEYLRLREKKGHKPAMMTLIRKYLRIIYQVLKKREAFAVPKGIAKGNEDIDFDMVDFTVEEG